MNKFPEEAFETLGYYVYRLIDPRNNKTFYVGKGCRNRVFAHVNEELRFYENVDDVEFVEDEVSAKMQTIHDIRKAGLEVRHVIHRYGMEEKEALEVEAALIDVYSELGELTNEQSGHDADRGMVDTDELICSLEAPEYEEPDNINYIIIKTTERAIDNNGSLYEATRRAWRLGLNKVKNIKYVLATMQGIVKEVYEVDSWFDSEEPERVEFHGHIAPEQIRNLFINKKIPSEYRKRGLANPALYSKNLTNSLMNSSEITDDGDDTNYADDMDCANDIDSVIEYDEPGNIEYIIVKTKDDTVRIKGSLYEASHKAWTLSFDKVQNYKYVLSTIDGKVREVYKVDRWYRSDEDRERKVEFTGEVAEDNVRNLFINKLLPQVYRKPGCMRSSLYSKHLKPSE